MSLFSGAEIGNSRSKSEYEASLADLRVELLNLQYDLGQADFSVLLLVAGDDRPGAVALMRVLGEWMDSRYIDTHVMFDDEPEDESGRPVLWRYWVRLPPKGGMGLFFGGWPTLVVRTALEQDWSDLELDGILDHVERFERQLALEGTLVLKFWVHLPKDEHKKRLKDARRKPEEHWQFEARDWEILENYDSGLQLVERLLRKTNTPRAPWIIVEGTDWRFRNLTFGQKLAQGLRNRMESGPPPAPASPAMAGEPHGRNVLEQMDLSEVVDPAAYAEELSALQARLNDASRAACAAGISCVMVFEGVDAAGKGGAIRRLTAALPVQSFRVVPIAAPTEEERARHYLWRFWRRLPGRAETTIFDRSWYGRVLVERVEGFADEAQWGRAYEEINDFESSLDQHGIPVIKFWLQIDAQEQLQRFEARAQTPYKKYKLTDEDYRNREKWDDYQHAAHDMITKTGTSYAPWYLIGANDKKRARLEILRIVCERFEARLEASSGKPKKKKAGKPGKSGKSGKSGKKSK